VYLGRDTQTGTRKYRSQPFTICSARRSALSILGCEHRHYAFAPSLQPFLLDPLPVTLAENLATYNMKPVNSARAKNESCDVSGQIHLQVLATAAKR
jgi:hypothetical protein